MILILIIFHLLTTSFISSSPLVIEEELLTQTGLIEEGSYLLRFEQEHIDLGAVKHGDQRKFEFKFINTSTEIVQIDIVSSCECTSLEWPTEEINPGESGTIYAIFDSTEKKKSETVDVDIILKNLDPKSGNPIMLFLSYEYELVK